MRSYPWRSEARRSSIHGPQRAGPQPDDTEVCTPAIGLAGRYRIGPSPVRNAFTPTNQGDAHLSSHRQLASRAAPVGAYKNREHRYLGIEVDDALAIAEQVDVWLPWQSRPALPLRYRRLRARNGSRAASFNHFIARGYRRRRKREVERAGPGCLDSAPLDLSGFLPGYAERGALRFCRCVGRA